MIVFHHNDADGRCAAAIVRKWVLSGACIADGLGASERLVFVEMGYKDPAPLEQIKRDDTVVIVDFSFKPDDMAAVQAATDEGVIWCDHHKTAEAYGYEVPGLRDFTDKGRSGCELAWEFFFPNDTTPLVVTLIGDYDSWRLELAPSSFEFYEGLKLFDQSPESMDWEELFESDSRRVQVQSMGCTAIAYRDAYCREICEFAGYEVDFHWHTCLAVNAYRFGSALFGKQFKDYSICISYIHHGDKYTVSLYSETVDVGKIAQEYGGGGHKGAAGFVCSTIPWPGPREAKASGAE